MKKTIFKYSINGSFIKIPDGGEILSVQHQNGVPTMWVLVDTDKPLVDREFLMFGTGDEIEVDGLTHIHTLQENGYVWHIFERVAPKSNDDKTNAETLDDIFTVLSEARAYGMESEVVWSALGIMKKHPNISISDAMQYGLNEWVK